MDEANRSFDFASSATRAEGLTFVEVILVTLISSIAVAGFSAFYVGQQRAHLDQRVRIEASQQLRAATELIGRDLRMAGYDPTGSGNFALTVAEANRIEFSSDDNLDDPTKRANGVREAVEVAHYQRTGTTLEYCGQNGLGCSPIANFVSAVAFQYFDGAGTAIAAPVSATDRPRVRRVDVSITVSRPGPYGTPDVDRTHRASAYFRNLR